MTVSKSDRFNNLDNVTGTPGLYSDSRCSDSRIGGAEWASHGAPHIIRADI